ncbi:arylsulfotransferase family protein [Rhodospirillaceae bacterium SYSU D60014]|uniref:arylsulfotransferase family protein n=1 Tax=Virgifigura deserti TaxID=2268457 RepID=UPI000E65EEA0
MDQQDRREGSDEASGQSSRLDKALFVAFIAALMLIALMAGAIVTAADIFPGTQIARAYQGAKAYYEKLTAYQDVYASDLWQPVRGPDQGVTTYRPSQAQDGVTLYSSGHDAAAFLVSMEGEVLHEWRRPFSTVWNENAAVKNPQPDSYVYFRKATVYPNGDLLAVYEGAGDTPYGYGVVKLNRDSEVIWSYLSHTHHDIDIGPDGRIYLLTHEFVQEPLDGYGNLASPRLDDFLVVLSPEGEELEKIPLIQRVSKSPYRHLLHTVSSYAVADPLHANGVDVITEEAAANFPFGKPGQVLLSFRELGAIGVLDLDSEELVWAARGPWIGQHDPDILANGDILLFDNYGHFRLPERQSRVIEFDPRTMEIVWQYAGTADRPLDSAIRASQERLANGNTLITESNGGRILEVTPEGEIVWEFVNPVRGGADDAKRPIICWAQRLDPASLDPALLTPGQ